MKLFMVGASPYARKVRAAAIQLGLESQLELIIANPHHRPPELVAVNPLSKVPTLVDDQGHPHTDSLAICEYLDSLTDSFDLLPTAGDERHRALFRHSLAHGIMDCAVIRRVESLKSREADRDSWMDRQKQTIIRIADWFEADNDLDGPPTLDRLTLAAALGFLDFRFPGDAWRTRRPRLTAWYEAMAKTPPLAGTEPHD
ncbi:MAG: glutathione S-transferase family protein [Rhodospirillales bacterium]